MSKIENSTCKIIAERNDSTLSYGTGFFVTGNIILTCCHVIQNCLDKIEIFKCYNQNDTVLTARVIDKDEQCDYALLQLNEKFINEHILELCSTEIIPNNPIKIFGYPDDPQGRRVGENLTGTIQRFLEDSLETGHDTILTINNFDANTRYAAFSGSPVLNEHNQVTSVVKNQGSRDLGSVSIKKATAFLQKNNIMIKELKSRTVVISPGDKAKFIGDFELTINYLDRSFSNEADTTDYFIREKKKSPLTLSGILNTEDKIFLLGNPGIGKSTELKKFAQQKWITGETTEFIPIFKSLRDFTSTDSIENYLPMGWEKLHKVIFILDGIDEIAHIEYFTSKLETFITQNTHNQKTFKYIISCRTNVYKSISTAVSNFNLFYLKDLNQYESIELLKKNCEDDLEDFTFSNQLYNFLKTPFHVKILSDYINVEKKIPTNITSLWEQYISGRLSHDKQEKLRKTPIVIQFLKKWSSKVALVNELMKSNTITVDQLYTLIRENTTEFEAFKKNPLLNQKANEDNYFFEHRNIQEYFAAQLISKLTSDDIIKFICIEQDTNKTHPYLFNTITFLLNILEKDKSTDIIGWLSTYEPQLLFKADSSRIHDFRETVFREYFESEIITKAYWITTNRTFTVREIAEFGNCDKNFEFLMDFVKDTDSHFRLSISALELLNHFSIPIGALEKLKEDFMHLLSSEEVSQQIKPHILDCICHHKICVEDPGYLNDIFELFKQETNKEINRSLLLLLQQHEKPDDFFWYIEAEFLRQIGVDLRVVKDNRNEIVSWIIELLIIRLQNADQFINIAKYYFDDSKNINSTNSFAEELLKRCLDFQKLDDKFLVKLMSSFMSQQIIHYREELIVKLLAKSSTKSQLLAFEYIIEHSGFRSIERVLAMTSDWDNIDFVMEKYRTGSLDRTRIEVYKNAIEIYGDRKLAGYFYDTMVVEEFVFSEPFLDEPAYEELKAEPVRKTQENFDLLFDREKLFSNIQRIFEDFGATINSDNYFDIEEKWYHDNDYHKKIGTAYVLLRTATYNDEKDLIFEDMEGIFQRNLYVFEEIKSQIDAIGTANSKVNISPEQKEYLKNWVLTAAQEIRFDHIVRYINSSNYRPLDDYKKLGLILYFATAFDVELSEDFLLKSIEFFEIDNYSELDNTLGTLKMKIKNEALLDAQIIKNLESEKLIFPVLDRHIQHALDRKLSKAYPIIRKYLLAGKTSYNTDRKLAQYIEITNDINLLRDLCADLRSYNCWSAVKILMESDNQHEFCEKKAVEYLELEISDDKNYHYTTALSILFELNSLKALKYVCSFLDIKKIPSLNQTSYTHYNAVQDYNVLEKLFQEIYMRDGDEIGFSGLGNFLYVYVTNLSKEKAQYENTIGVLKSMRDTFQTTDNKNALFYINNLIDSSRLSFLNSLSRALSFDEALQKVEQIV